MKGLHPAPKTTPKNKVSLTPIWLVCYLSWHFVYGGIQDSPTHPTRLQDEIGLSVHHMLMASLGNIFVGTPSRLWRGFVQCPMFTTGTSRNLQLNFKLFCCYHNGHGVILLLKVWCGVGRQNRNKKAPAIKLACTTPPWPMNYVQAWLHTRTHLFRPPLLHSSHG